MAQKCDICGKIPSVGRNVSHSHRKSAKTWGVNVQKMRVRTASGAVKQLNVCTSCLRSNKVVKG